ncbi:RNA polymerase sigma factor [Streptomyces sp. NPDC001380]|uniref:RNA polymerase sigma factor n=1 Tax=Streptomyces sp. NPDC001380 TaxID=3364566 RepID=UPI0036B7B790
MSTGDGRGTAGPPDITGAPDGPGARGRPRATAATDPPAPALLPAAADPAALPASPAAPDIPEVLDAPDAPDIPHVPGAEKDLVARAVAGDAAALEEVVRLLQDPLYRLALRMSWRPADAEDALQEILVRVLTRLATWRAEARLLTWAYRIGVNHLLNLRRRTPQEAAELSLEQFRENLADGLAAEDHAGPEAALLAEEVRLTCSQAVLQCLERGERVAFVLGQVFDLPSDQAAWILDVTPAAYRKRLERARQRVRAFMRSTCGLVDPQAFCRCARRVEAAVASGRVDPRRPALATHPVSPGGRDVAEAAAQLHRLHDAAAVLNAHPDYAAPPTRAAAVLTLLRSGRFPLLE